MSGGDAADLMAVLEGEVRGNWGERPVVEGSQLLGQAIVAAGRRAPGRRVVHASMLFPRAVEVAGTVPSPNLRELPTSQVDK